VQWAASVCILGVIAGLVALGVWQLERRVWKLDLIARVEQRVRTPPADAPEPAEWPGLTAERDEYRHVRVSGRFINEHEAYVRAVTEFGAGYWVLAPFQADRGFVVLVNRGFISPDRRGVVTRAGRQTIGERAVTGLLRLSEPKGGFLHANDPTHDRWYSRDVAAIATSRGLPDAAPYFIDAEAAEVPGAWPRGGLTVLTFPNNHLVYAMTWFGLSFMLSAAVVFTRSERWPRRKKL
jgi:surfeit locus 1 family protein